MAQNFHKILRIKQLFNHQIPQLSITSHLLHHPQVTRLLPDAKFIQNPLPVYSTENKSTQYSDCLFYPSFSFGNFLNPISATGFSNSKRVEDPELETDGSETKIIWADSVKKKRKKKMNKHKLKKLKKRLRHCS